MKPNDTVREQLRMKPPGACRAGAWNTYCTYRIRLYRKYAIFACAACVLSVCLVSCGTDRVPDADIITVEGMVTVRGNEPFAAYVLETSDRNTYVLVFPEAVENPARLRVTGRLYLGEWDGQSYAHIEVHAYEELAE
jgi:hypothetical protein